MCAWQDVNAKGQFVVWNENHLVAIRKAHEGGGSEFHQQNTSSAHVQAQLPVSCSFHRPELPSAYYPRYSDAVFSIFTAADLLLSEATRANLDPKP